MKHHLRYLLLAGLLLCAMAASAHTVTHTTACPDDEATSHTSAADSLLVRAQVVDQSTGEVLPYVGVYQSADNATMTNGEGNFTLKVATRDTLKITCVGFEEMRIAADRVGSVVRLKPFVNAMREVEVYAEDKVLDKVNEKLVKEYRWYANRKSLFFYRMNTTYRAGDLVEAILQGKAATHLREMQMMTGQRGRKGRLGFRDAVIADMNFHHPLEVGPMINDSRFWRNLICPLGVYWDGQPYYQMYDRRMELLRGEDGSKVFRIHFDKQQMAQYEGGVLTGELYVDANTYDVLRFVGQVEGMVLDIKTGLVKKTVPIELKVHVDYQHTNGYTEVERMSTTLKNGDLQSHSVLMNVGGLKLGRNSRGKKVKGTRVNENVLAALDEAGFDQLLWEHANFVQRTAQEEEMAGVANDSLLRRMIPVDDPAIKRLPDTPIGRMVERLYKFGRQIPQEKVYCHLDNTCYFLGDTLWFSAYTRSTIDKRPSNVSGVLYAELYNQDGYLVQRKMIEMTNGRGHGNFVINKNGYAGFYELRAYTRWQLNWGQYEHPHSRVSKEWFMNPELEKRYYTDYDKLYSRVFPVYDTPSHKGEYMENMSLRPMMRYFKNDPDKRTLQLAFYPEGGALVEGVPCRVAFEAAYDDGEWVEGTLHVGTQTVRTQNRGRGVFTLTPTRDMGRTVTFEADDRLRGLEKNGREVRKAAAISAKLPEAEKEGVALSVQRTSAYGAAEMPDSLTCWQVKMNLAGLSPDSLGVTVMHEGRLLRFSMLNELPDNTLLLEENPLPAGVNQVTVFDAKGRVYADRLFFVNKPNLLEPNLQISGVKPVYAPYEKIELSVNGRASEAAGVPLSVSVRDVAHQDVLFDNATMLTEMLLSSEIKGFVPNPGWYFESQDKEHQEGLDLLLMTQGWRRFNWRDMAVSGEWELSHPDERTPIVTGTVYATRDESMDTDGLLMDLADPVTEGSKKSIQDVIAEARQVENEQALSDGEKEVAIASQDKGYSVDRIAGRDWVVKNTAPATARVHAELIEVENSMKPTVAEYTLEKGKFRIKLPKFYGQSVLFISAVDTAKVKDMKHYAWIQMRNDPEATGRIARRFAAPEANCIVRVHQPYPRFVKPYNFYQQHLSEAADKLLDPILLADGTHQMREVKVGAKRSGMKHFSDSIPAFMVDGYKAYNDALDAGMFGAGDVAMARAYLSDYGLDFPYVTVEGGKDDRISTRFGLDLVRRSTANLTLDEDSVYMRQGLSSFTPEGRFISPYELKKWYEPERIDRYVFYTDYQPRLEGSARYEGSNLPFTYVVRYLYPDDSRRVFYRDRRYVIEGYAVCEDFYHPNYANRKVGDVPNDYRRTLYWNPDLKLDNEGRARILIYNNGKNTQIAVSAEGLSPKGVVLEGRGE